MARVIQISVYGKCNTICEGDSVALELTDEWAARLADGSNLAIAEATVVSKGSYRPTTRPYTNQSLCYTAPGRCCPTLTNPCTCCPPPTSVIDCKLCWFQVSIDTAQFTVNPETGVEYEPACTDVIDIAPYYGIISKLITAIGAP